jgi:transcription antitermination factor NusG
MTLLESGWYAVQVQPKCERFVAELLGAKGYERFVPFYMARRRWSDRTKVLELPLIPHYVFCRITADAIGPIVTTPRVVRIVGCGRTPIPVDQQEIDALQRIDGCRLQAEPWPFLRVGQEVAICGGPLDGVRGVLVRHKGADRLIVSVTLLQRAVAVEVDAQSVIPVASDRVA